MSTDTIEVVVCSNTDLHENDTEGLILDFRKYYVVRLSCSEVVLHDPSPVYVYDFLNGYGYGRKRSVKYGVCGQCYDILEQSQELIESCGGK